MDTRTAVAASEKSEPDKIWLEAVYGLYTCINNRVKNLKEFDKTAACSYLGTVLSYIRKNNYTALQANPEDMGAIPSPIFLVIDNYIKKHPLILDSYQKGLLSADFIKGIEVKLYSNSLDSFLALNQKTKTTETRYHIAAGQSK